MKPIIQLDIIFEAAIFAACKHQGHIRKDALASPYITHPLTVAREIYATGKVDDPSILVAAILHDTLEDTKTTQDELRQQFGEDVLSIVLEVTDDKSLIKERRKQLQVIHAPQLSYAARIIKLADKLVNCRDILHMPPRDWSLVRRQEYIQWSADVLAQVRGVNPSLEAAFDKMAAQAEAELDFTLQSFDTVNQRPWGPETGIPSP
jgi:GTP diphosphokinase / guanosine-3',5'-bis(diphosphate) 3'-diphosphatase